MSYNPNEWKPEPKQELFLSIPTTIKEAFYGGGAGSGKSDVLLLYGIVHRWHEHPKFKQVFLRRTFPELRNEIIPRSRELYRKFGATLNKTEMCWTFPRMDQYGTGTSTKTGPVNEGAMIFLGHCENEDDVHNYDTMQINLFTPDELTSITEWIYLYIGFQRVRSPVPELPSIIRAAGMPGGIGHTWTYKRFIKPAPKGGKVIIGRGGNKRIYIHSTLEDNKHIDPTYKQSLQGITIEAERKAKLLGDWDAYQGQVFDEFRDRKFEDEPANALHVVPEFEIPAWWPRIIVGDWGYTAMTWIGYAAISPNKRVYIYREQHWVKTKIAMFFGESMFARQSDASKVALAHLVWQLRRWNFELIDCQMTTSHLASLGAREVPRRAFNAQISRLVRQPPIPGPWRVDDDLCAAL